MAGIMDIVLHDRLGRNQSASCSGIYGPEPSTGTTQSVTFYYVSNYLRMLSGTDSLVTHRYSPFSVTLYTEHIMVKVEIVDEKENSSPYASSDSSRTSSSASLSSVDSNVSTDESFFDRIVALKDIVPPATRHTIFTRVSKTASFMKSTSKVVGNIIWVITTSALLVGLPLALVMEDEAKFEAQEKEMLEQQQGAQQVGFWHCLIHILFPHAFLPFLDDGTVLISSARFREPTKSPCSTWFLNLDRFRAPST